MNRLLLAAALSLATFGASAVSYTNTGGYTNTTSTSSTKTHNVTVRDGYQKIKTTDVSYGGLDNTTGCDPINCSGSDNKTIGNTTKIVKTDLTITSIGESTRTSTTASCFSGSNMNGLAHQEARSTENFSVSGWNNTTAEGTVVATTINRTKTTNGGAEVGSSYEKIVDTTSISEVTNSTFTSNGQIITFTSSVGE